MDQQRQSQADYASEDNSNLEMDSEQAKILFEQGALFVIQGFPAGAEFGIDNSSWTVGPNFQGIKMIPAGLHFLYFSSVDSNGQPSPRSGFFYNFRPKEILVKKWDRNAENISVDKIPQDEIERFEANKQELDRFLGPYPYDMYRQWVSLTNYISDDMAKMLEPDCKVIYSVAQFESPSSTTQSRQAEAAEAQNKEMNTDLDDTGHASKRMKLPKLTSVSETVIKYSCIPKKKYPDGASPAEITKYSMDSSYALNLLLSLIYDKDISKLLAEVQFAFVCFLVGQNYDSFEQWKKLVHLLCTSGEAVLKYPDAYLSLITILYFQIREIPSDFFVDIVTSNNFLTSTLYELFQNAISEDTGSKLKKKALGFRKHLTDKFGWDFTSDPDDCAPVIVDT